MKSQVEIHIACKHEYLCMFVNTPYTILCHGQMGGGPIAFAGVGAAENKGIAFGFWGVLPQYSHTLVLY